MDINNHAKYVELKLAKPESTEPVVDMTTSTISEGISIQYIAEPTECTLFQLTKQADITQPILYKHLRHVGGLPDDKSPYAAGPINVLVYGEFIRRLVKTYIGFDSEVPVYMTEGYADGLKRALVASQNKDGSYGDNHMSQDDINYMIGMYPKSNVEINNGESTLVDDILYLPLTNVDINRDATDLDAFPSEYQTTIRTAYELSSFQTYMRILLLDGTEFILWNIGKNKLLIGKM